jgi:hypothetical protein
MTLEAAITDHHHHRRRFQQKTFPKNQRDTNRHRNGKEKEKKRKKRSERGRGGMTEADAAQAPKRDKIRYPGIVDVKWRVDVSISTSAMARTMTPLVLMQVTLSDGAVWTFEVPHDKFHELRYNVARVLHDIEQIDQLPILKIKT